LYEMLKSWLHVYRWSLTLTLISCQVRTLSRFVSKSARPVEFLLLSFREGNFLGGCGNAVPDLLH
jgi:hypothetical protein